MAFTVDDFQDLLRLLEERPDWRATLRRQVLSDELLQLPELLRSLADAQRRTDEQLAALTSRVDALAMQVDALTAQVDALTAQVHFLVGRVGDMDGELMELRFARRAPAYLGRFGRGFRVVDPSRLADLLDAAVDAGQMTDADHETVMLADVVAQGRRRGDGAAAYIVAEVSSGIGVDDVRRVLDRSRLLAKLGEPVVPVVAGRWINGEAEQYARSSGVEQVLVPRKTSLPEREPPAA